MAERMSFVATQASQNGAVSAVEAALFELRRAVILASEMNEPVLGMSEAARCLEGALGAVLDAIDERAERAAATRSAEARIDAALAALARSADEPPEIATIVASLESARQSLSRASSEPAAKGAAPIAPPPPGIQASEGLPRLHTIARSSLVPPIVVARGEEVLVLEAPAAIPKPETFEALAEAVEKLRARRKPITLPAASAEAKAPVEAPKREVRPGFSAEIAGAISAKQFREDRARECFEEIAMAAMQREPLPGDDWRDARSLEARMLRAVDWLAALGPQAIEHVPRLFSDAPVKDAPHAFAFAMALGCVAGRDTLAAVESLVLGPVRGEEEPAKGIFDALKLVPHDKLSLALRSLAREPDPVIRAMAIEALGFRGLVTEEELARAARDPSSLVALAALRELSWSPSSSLAELIDRFSGTNDPALREARLEAMALSGHPRAMAELRAESGDSALHWLAIAGDEMDARDLVSRMNASPTPALVSAVGFSGLGCAIAPLARLLAHEDEEIVAAAGAALDRITGASLVEEVEVAAEEILAPEPPPVAEPSVGETRAESLAKSTSDPRDLPPQPATERVTRPATSLEAWSAWLRAEGRTFQDEKRYRRGEPYAPTVVLAELAGPRCSVSERRLLVRELVIRTGRVVRLDPHDWVASQEKALAAWEPIARRASSTPGSFSRPGRV